MEHANSTNFTHRQIQSINKYKKTIYLIIMDGYNYAKKSHKNAINDKNNVALIYLNVAISKFTSAKIFYHQNSIEVEHLDFDELNEMFHCFDTFQDELIECVVTDHSKQWTDIEFERFEEKYNDAVTVLGF